MFFNKGKIEVATDKQQYSTGELIQGEVTLDLKKPVDGKELFIKLFAYEKSTSGMGSRRSTRTTKIYDYKLDLDSEKQYSSGLPSKYSFSLQIPSQESSSMDGAPSEALQQVVKFAQMASGRKRQVKWFVEARLVVPGLFNDIKKKMQIQVLD